MNGLDYFKGLWTGEDLFIVGGGPSLQSFDFKKLAGRRVIGCNDAYTLGSDIVDVNVFGDQKWFEYHEEKGLLEKCKVLVTCHEDFENYPNVYWFERDRSGLFCRDKLAWMGNTGALAINLALITGAKRIYLLGFDMTRNEKNQTNWHDNPLDNPTNAYHYANYKEKMQDGAKWKEVFPECEDIVNLNPHSKLETFRKSTWDAEIKN